MMGSLLLWQHNKLTYKNDNGCSEHDIPYYRAQFHGARSYCEWVMKTLYSWQIIAIVSVFWFSVDCLCIMYIYV